MHDVYKFSKNNTFFWLEQVPNKSEFTKVKSEAYDDEYVYMTASFV